MTLPGPPGPGEGAEVPPGPLLKASLRRLEEQPDKFMAHFFATLFVRHPELRAVLPLEMEAHQRGVFAALAHCVRYDDSPQVITRWLSELALDHRRYGVTPRHIRQFCDALRESVRVFSATTWNPGLEAAWQQTLGYVSAVMSDAIGADEGPAWWLAEVAGHDLRRPDLAILTLRPDSPLPYQPGQHISVQVPQRPRLWREYSIANAPRPDGLLRLHVRAVPGGAVSPVLVHQTRPGDTLVLGRARGRMTAGALSRQATLCVAGGTGLAPVKAIAEALANHSRRPPHPAIHLLVGARDEHDLYDLPALRRLASTWPALTVTPVVAYGPGYRGVRGTLPEVTARCLPPGTGEVVISGPPGMVTRTAAVVASVAPGARVHFDPADTGGGPL